MNKIFSSASPELKDATFESHAEAALSWIQEANVAVDGKGISKGFDLLRWKWSPSYPETTGYTIPTLLNAGIYFERVDLSRLALSLADDLLEVITPEGGVAHWQASTDPTPIVFDTGMVVFGWLAAFDATGERKYLQAAERSGNWLVSIQDVSGAWKMNQHQNVVKVIDTRVAWALLELSRRTGKAAFERAAVKNLDWAVQHQNGLGWFDSCAFRQGDDPFTHTLAYTAEGLFECGVILERSGWIEASNKMAAALITKQRSDGSLAATYASDWSESHQSSCLTGNCQMSVLWLSLYRRTGDRAYYQAAHKSLRFVAATQVVTRARSQIRGAIAGSFPIYGVYERFKYPNWAAKFFIDAVLELITLDQEAARLPYKG